MGMTGPGQWRSVLTAAAVSGSLADKLDDTGQVPLQCVHLGLEHDTCLTQGCHVTILLRAGDTAAAVTTLPLSVATILPYNISFSLIILRLLKSYKQSRASQRYNVLLYGNEI